MFPLSLDKNGETMFGTYRRNSEASGGICESLLNSKLCFLQYKQRKHPISVWQEVSGEGAACLETAAAAAATTSSSTPPTNSGESPLSGTPTRTVAFHFQSRFQGDAYVCICHLFSSSRVNRYGRYACNCHHFLIRYVCKCTFGRYGSYLHWYPGTFSIWNFFI